MTRQHLHEIINDHFIQKIYNSPNVPLSEPVALISTKATPRPVLLGVSSAVSTTKVNFRRIRRDDWSRRRFKVPSRRAWGCLHDTNASRICQVIKTLTAVRNSRKGNVQEMRYRGHLAYGTGTRRVFQRGDSCPNIFDLLEGFTTLQYFSSLPASRSKSNYYLASSRTHSARLYRLQCLSLDFLNFET